VVSLEPVRSHLALEVSRELHLSRFTRTGNSGRHESAYPENGLEEIEDSRYDLFAPLLEDFALAIDPYPRAPGVVFEAPRDLEAPESPFAALKPLKGR
jgi:hypothetical protein